MGLNHPVKLPAVGRKTVVEEIRESIDVLTVFRNGRLEPMKFKWTGRTHSVSRITFRWVTKEGQYPVYHFALEVENMDGAYELAFRPATLGWQLVYVQTG